MKTFEIMNLIVKISQNKDAVIKTFLNNFFEHYPQWSDSEKKFFITSVAAAIEKTHEGLK